MSPFDSFSLRRWAGAALAPLALAAAGCTVQVVMPEVPASHPAHPDAEAAPLPEPSPLLDSYRPVAPPPEMAPMDHGTMDHGEMDHGEMDHEGMDHEAMGHGEMEAEEADPEEAEDPHRHHHPEPPPPGAP
jgi:copper resistance protein B